MEEVLDWGNEEDENNQETLGTPSFAEDADDAVSLGDEDEALPFYVQQVQENGNDSSASAKPPDLESTSHLGSATPQEVDLDRPPLLQQASRQDETQAALAAPANASGPNESPKRSQPLLQPRLTHALPPKPVVATLPYMPPSHHSIVEATAMGGRARDFKRNSGSAEKTSQPKDVLPPNWEIRYPRSGGRTVYYYNIATHQSTWQHPGHSTPSGRTKSVSTSTNPPPLVDSYVPQSLSYEDRHYRPDGSPDPRREDRTNNGPGGERVQTPPLRSPRSRDRPRSASPPPLTSREVPSEIRDTDLQRELLRDTDLPAADSTGHTNSSIRHQQSPPTSIVKPTSPAIEDKLPLHRSRSTLERSREPESLSNTVEDRQEANHSLGLASSRPRSLSLPRDREWINGQREQSELDQVPKESLVSVKTESTPHAAPAPLGSRRDRPSRFGRPSAAALHSPATPVVVSSSLVERSITPPERDVHTAEIASASALHTQQPDRNAGHGNAIKPLQETSIEYVKRQPVDDNGPTPTAGGHDRWQVSLLDSERAPLASDQPGSSRRKRAPLPPQSDSFREETSKGRDHKEAAIRPASTSPSTELKSAPAYGSHQLAPHTRVEPGVEYPRRRSVSGNQLTNDGRRGRAVSADGERNGAARSYSRTRTHPAVDMPMDVDPDYLPAKSSRVLPGSPSRPQDNMDDGMPPWAAKSISTRPPASGTTASETSTSCPAGEMRRDGASGDYMESPLSRQALPPKNQRTIHERSDKHVPRRQSRGRSNERRNGPFSPAPRLTGPNSVPIGARRSAGPNSDINPRFAEDASPASYPVESPLRSLKPLPTLLPSKGSHERPVYGARDAVDDHHLNHQSYASNDQHRRGINPPAYDRDYQPNSSETKEVRRDGYPQERSRSDHLGPGNRISQSDDRPAPRGRSRSPPGKPRALPSWLPPKPVDTLPPASFNSDFLSDRNIVENRDYRPGAQGQQRPPQPENYHPYSSRSSMPLPEGSRRPNAENAVRTSKRELQRHHQEDHPPSRGVSSQLPAARPLLVEERQHGTHELGQLDDVSEARLPDDLKSKEMFNRESNRSRPPRRSDPPNPRKVSSIDDLTKRPYPYDAYSGRFDNSYADQSLEQAQTQGMSTDRGLYPQARRHQSERSRHADASSLNTPSMSEYRRSWGDQALSTGYVPETHEDRKAWRSGPVERYEPDYDDYDEGVPETPQRQHRHPLPPPFKRVGGQRGEQSYRDDPPYGTPQYHDRETRTGTRRLLDRLTLDEPHMSQDRVKIPGKRDRNEVDHDYSMSVPIVGGGAGEPAPKRARRRANRMRRGRRGSGAS